MLIIIGYVIVLVATLGGFMIAGGNPVVLLHVSEFVVIGGIALGVLVVASPSKTIKHTIHASMVAFKGALPARADYMDLFKILYELFMTGKKSGLIALDEHVSSPETSAIFQKYPGFLKHKDRLSFLCNGLKPIIDGKIKPDQLQPLLEAEIKSKEQEGHGPLIILGLVGDSLPGIGIVAAVLGIINTMAAIADGPEAVGQKVAAALTGTFLGILGAYGFINPLTNRIKFNDEMEIKYFQCMATAISSFARGLAPIMAIEIARRSLDHSLTPGADELEQELKNALAGK
ncbi:flagellar motor stator protein MotA [Opitutales bacterium ASA1]|jgi:chemotaxis protein MotA|uniref:motility-associated protein n=1 Tax=Congregicoccus parvus TaxID=3081749 RepID=UPI002B312CB5|nr:flagellar motor stator protein MotA [Opitutales bacterium ASA1]